MRLGHGGTLKRATRGLLAEFLTITKKKISHSVFVSWSAHEAITHKLKREKMRRLSWQKGMRDPHKETKSPDRQSRFSATALMIEKDIAKRPNTSWIPNGVDYTTRHIKNFPFWEKAPRNDLDPFLFLFLVTIKVVHKWRNLPLLSWAWRKTLFIGGKGRRYYLRKHTLSERDVVNAKDFRPHGNQWGVTR